MAERTERLSESLTRALLAGAKALREQAASAKHELEEDGAQTSSTIHQVVRAGIEEKHQHADMLEGYLKRNGHRNVITPQDPSGQHAGLRM